MHTRVFSMRGDEQAGECINGKRYSSMEAKQPLSGTRVLEFGQVIAAPFAAALLADFGADVIKIEPPGKGDVMRSLGPKSGDVSAWWRSTSRNKRLLCLDWKKPGALEVIEKLVRSSHVLIENFRPGVLERNGFGPEVLLKWNPDLIILRISGFGQSGPYRDRPGFGKVAEAFSGVSDLTGPKDGPPVSPGWPMADTSTGLMGAFGVVLALLSSARGRAAGQVIDLAIYETPLRLIEYHVPIRTSTGVFPTRNGNRQPLSFALAGTYQSADGKWITYSAANYAVAKRVVGLIGESDWANQAQFESMEGICAEDDEIDRRLTLWIKARPADDVLKIFLEANAAAGLVNTVDDILSDVHVADRNNIVQVDDDKCKIINVVPKLSQTPGSVNWLGRSGLGENTVEILRECAGLDDESIAALVKNGVVFETPNHVDSARGTSVSSGAPVPENMVSAEGNHEA
jgi:crotonobetainyl-CoA:carnitine CoA-transferase CaiB-like acyl-CoA transferase